ncbi:MAG: hypothetical protein HY864_08130 [Chloroflexi bacterium]|nr:hypothetical protein [Chloroflexota bacterium]
MTKSNNSQLNICPFLGLTDDQTSHMAFTSAENICYQCNPNVQIKLTHQNDFCLDSRFKNCPVYVKGAGKPMPADLIYDEKEDQHFVPLPMDRRILWISAAFAGIFLFTTLFFFLNRESEIAGIPPSPSSFNPSQISTATAVLPLISPATQNPQATLSPIANPPLTMGTITASPFPTLTPTAPTSTSTTIIQLTGTATVPTPTEIPPHSLEVPIGKKQQYIIHRVKNGENLPTLIETYETSLEAILAVNPDLVIPIRIDALVVIPIKVLNPAGLPKLEPYQVTHDKVTISMLAEQLKTDLSLIVSVNGLEVSEELIYGNWVLVPR